MTEKPELKLVTLGEKVELLYRFDNTLLPYLIILGKIGSLRNIDPVLREHFNEDDVHRILLLMEMLCNCSDIIEDQND
jgi:hypothetical protein